MLTTPQLHYMVRCHNTAGGYGEGTELGYYKKLSKAFLQLRAMTSKEKPQEIKLDGANGVGGSKITQLVSHMKGELPLTVYNEGNIEKMNEKCGADFVKLHQCEPEGMTISVGDKCVTYDGDADRVMYFFIDDEKKFRLLDGDRIATLIAGYLKEKIDQAEITLDKELGLVQTAYANGSSTKYAQEELKVPVAFAKTGVKYVHHRAEQFDIGVYFEANGHGTILFSADAVSKVNKMAKSAEAGSDQQKAALELVSTIDLINQSVGDAMSDMLVVETILNSRRWDLPKWYSCYNDLFNRQLKVKVQDRTVLKTSEIETEALEPKGLQDAINKAVAKFSQARSFARPSGTEDVVRVYAESDSREDADALALEVSQLVYDFAGGVGDRPQ